MRPRPRVLDASSLVDMFAGHERLGAMVNDAEQGALHLLLPTTAIAAAEAQLNAGRGGWDPFLLTHGVQSLPLAEHTAIEIGAWPGELATRHAVHEATATRGVVVTRKPGAYEGFEVSLVVVRRGFLHGARTDQPIPGVIHRAVGGGCGGDSVIA